MTERQPLKLTMSANSILRKIELKSSEGSNANSPANFTHLLFLIIIIMLIIAIELF